MSKVRLLLVLFALVGSVGSLRGATFVVPPDEWLIDDSPVIVSGTVVDAHPRLSAGQDIETVFRVAVDEVLKGQLASGDLEVVEWGGRIGERWTLVPGAPRYESGKRYVIFLYPKANGEWTTQNLTLGRFEFVSSPRGEMLVRDAEEVRGWDIHGNVAQEVERSADGFLAFIRNRARGIGGVPDYAIGGTLVPAPQTRKVQTTDFAGYDFADAANVGVARWNDDGDSNVNFSISGSPATGNGKNAGDGEDRIIEEDPNDIIAGAFTGSGTVAVAYLSSAGTHSFEGKTYLSIVGADIVTQNGFKTNGSSQSVFRTAMAHEVGHTLGFRHSNKSPDDQANCAAPLPCVSGSSNAVMNSSVGALNGNLQSWDTDAVRAAYGSGGDASDYTSKFCANPGCSTFTSETGRMSSPSRSFRLAQQACAPPSLSTVQNKSIQPGGTTSLSVVASGTSPFTYQWYIGASNTDESNPVGGGTSATLGNLSPASTTQYWVKVTNACGTALSNVATVTVQACVPPSITTQPQPKTTSIGVAVRVSVSAAGTGPLSYQWYAGNSGDTSTPINGATTSSPNITLNATANVWVRVTGQCAPPADSNAVTITVNACPDVVVGIPTATGSAQNWTLSVNATSTAPGSLTYEWFRGSNPGSSVAPKVGEGQSLPVVVTTVTQYWAKVTNSCGTVRFSELVVVAPCQLPVITTQPADRTIPKGTSTQLTVVVSGEGVSVQWYLGTAPDKSNAVGAGASIQAGPLQETTSYWAALTNTCGEIPTRTVVVTVDDSCAGPVITTQPEDRSVPAGATTQLSVGFTGENVTVQWYEGVAPDTSRPVGAGASITTPPINLPTAFWARLTNGCGQAATRTVQVGVSGTCQRPVITTQPLAVQAVAPGETATLGVVATGTPLLRYQWYEGPVGDTSKPVGTDSPLYTTPPLTAAKSYWVKISNDCGEASSQGSFVGVGNGRRRAARH